MEIHEAVEVIAYLYFDGKIEQRSKFEAELCTNLISQIKNNDDISYRTPALCWIYFQAHARNPLGHSVKVLNAFNWTMFVRFFSASAC